MFNFPLGSSRIARLSADLLCSYAVVRLLGLRFPFVTSHAVNKFMNRMGEADRTHSHPDLRKSPKSTPHEQKWT